MLTVIRSPLPTVPPGSVGWSANLREALARVMAVTSASTDTLSYLSVDLVNAAPSPFGAGWSLDNQQRLWTVLGQGELLELPGGRSLFFAYANGAYVSPPGDFSTLTFTFATQTYTRTMPDGTQYNFSAAGLNPDNSRWLTHVTSFTYTLHGFVASVEDANGHTTSFGYNARFRLQTVTEPYVAAAGKSYTVNYGYDAAGNPTSRTDERGNTVHLTYDPMGRLLTVTFPDTSQATYAYDAASRVTTYTSSLGESLTYSYDNTNQLKGVFGTHAESYGYDLNGNRTMAGYATTYQNRLTQAVEANGVTYSYTYDSEGNMLSKVGTEGGQLTTYAFSWDYRNRLTNVTVTRGGTTAYNVTYTYDVFDRRIGEKVNGTTQRWTVYDGDNPYADFDGSGNLTNRYLYGEGMDSLLAKFSAANTVTWYLTDALGSVRQTVQTDGATGRDDITYDSFGNVLTESNPANGDRFKYTAREWDPNTGLQYNRARYYSPGSGRWIGEDPIGFGGGDTNLYRYGANHPISNLDPSGSSILIRDKETLDWFLKKLDAKGYDRMLWIGG